MKIIFNFIIIEILQIEKKEIKIHNETNLINENSIKLQL